MAKEKKKGNKKVKIVFALIAVFLVVGICFGGFMTLEHYLDKINKIGDESQLDPSLEDFLTDGDVDPNSEVLDPNAINWDEFQALGDEHLLNILLVGQDRRPGEGRQRSDSMILCSVNLDKKQVSIISFLRDMYVQIPGYSDNRLNAAYCFGGFKLLKSTLYQNFGITVDGCFEVDFDGFRTVIDTIGGVDIELTAKEAEIIGDGARQGVCHLDGAHALRYARIRKIDSDFGRTARQRTVLMAAYKKIKNESFTELMSLLDTLLPIFSTDLTNAQIRSYAVQAIPLVSSMKINSYYVPGEGCYRNATIRKMAVLVPDLSEIRKHLKTEYMPF